jgi:uncharacterized membrane protein YfcA
MGILDLTTHFATVSTTGVGALIAAWFAWRLWRRLLRAVIACVVVGLVVYLMFRGVVQQLVRDERAPATSNTGYR